MNYQTKSQLELCSIQNILEARILIWIFRTFFPNRLGDFYIFIFNQKKFA